MHRTASSAGRRRAVKRKAENAVHAPGFEQATCAPAPKTAPKPHRFKCCLPCLCRYFDAQVARSKPLAGGGCVPLSPEWGLNPRSSCFLCGPSIARRYVVRHDAAPGSVAWLTLGAWPSNERGPRAAGNGDTKTSLCRGYADRYVESGEVGQTAEDCSAQLFFSGAPEKKSARARGPFVSAQQALAQQAPGCKQLASIDPASIDARERTTATARPWIPQARPLERPSSDGGGGGAGMLLMTVWVLSDCRQWKILPRGDP